MGRMQGRITREDVKEAGFRRWDGRQRITTDWINLFHEPELCLPSGDCLVYLREPGQSSRGPAFRVHTAHLRARGFQGLLDRCIARAPKHTSPKCALTNCTGCDMHFPTRELYIPAPPRSAIDIMFDHHLTTRNFFAWLYDIPLAGRALGQSLVAVKDRIDFYRPRDELQNKLDVVAYAESQRYLDFRECADHALASLYLAEVLQIEKLWVDAFAHCVGLKHRGLRDSIEYEPLSFESKALISRTRLDLDIKLSEVNESVRHFFENDLSGHSFGLHAAARDHLDRFRSFLHGFYIEQHGFWPPEDFGEPQFQRQLYTSMYLDFRNLYHHLADPKSSSQGTVSDVTNSGGVCTLQNIQAFDARNQYDALPSPLPMLPVIGTTDLGLRGRSQRRNPWNPIAKRKKERETRNARSMQALIDSTNRDWNLMNCLLIRRYSEFEIASAVDSCETISIVDARKVRWILVYAILQTLISVVQAPKQVRNTEGLTYSLCCKLPERMPWQLLALPPQQHTNRSSVISPDNYYSHTNGSNSTLGRSSSQITIVKKERRQTLSVLPTSRSLGKSPSTSRSKSLRRLMPRRTDSVTDEIPKRRLSYCEIYVQGYGNGLNEVQVEHNASSSETTIQVKDDKPAVEPEIPQPEAEADPPVPRLPGSPSVSRESSNASSSSAWSRGSSESDTDVSTPDTNSKTCSLQEALQVKNENGKTAGQLHILDESNLMHTVHINTKTWDALLGL